MMETYAIHTALVFYMGKSYETTCVVHVGILAHTLHMYAALITCLPHAYSTQRKAHRGAHNINILAICTTGVEIKHGCMKERLRGEL